MLDTFLKTGAIDKMQYEKSLNGLKEKMGVNYDIARFLQQNARRYW